MYPVDANIKAHLIPHSATIEGPSHNVTENTVYKTPNTVYPSTVKFGFSSCILDNIVF